MVEILIPSAAANHGPAQTALGQCTAQFYRCFVRSGHGKNGEALKAGGMACDDRGDKIVCLHREPNTLHRLKIVQSRRSDGEHLNVYSAFVH